MVTRIQRQNILELDKLENWAKWRHGLIAVLFSRPAGLRRSFRLSRKEKENGVNEGKPAEQADPAEFLTYEEVTQYQQQPGDQQRLVVLIGRSTIGSNLFTINHQKKTPTKLIKSISHFSTSLSIGFSLKHTRTYAVGTTHEKVWGGII